MNESIEFIKEYCEFSNPNNVWILKGVSRNKDNPNNEVMDKFFHRSILTKADDIEEAYFTMRKSATDLKTVYRIYISLNARDAVAATFNFQKKLIDVGYGLSRGLEDALVSCKKLGSLWKTELEQSSCRGTKRFLLDLDETQDEALIEKLTEKIKETSPKIHCVRKTVSGIAFSFDACDTRALMSYVKENGVEADLQRDSMVFIERFHGAEEALK